MGPKRVLTPIDAEIEELGERYSFPGGRDKARIVSILRAKPPAMSLLKEGAEVLKAIFGDAAGLSLELDRDPESGFEEIFATVRTAHSPEAGLDLLEEFDEGWWLERARQVGGKLNFTWEPC